MKIIIREKAARGALHPRLHSAAVRDIVPPRLEGRAQPGEKS